MTFGRILTEREKRKSEKCRMGGTYRPLSCLLQVLEKKYYVRMRVFCALTDLEKICILMKLELLNIWENVEMKFGGGMVKACMKIMGMLKRWFIKQRTRQ